MDQNQTQAPACRGFSLRAKQSNAGLINAKITLRNGARINRENLWERAAKRTAPDRTRACAAGEGAGSQAVEEVGRGPLASDDLSASTATGESGKGILCDFNAPPGRRPRRDACLSASKHLLHRSRRVRLASAREVILIPSALSGSIGATMLNGTKSTTFDCSQSIRELYANLLL